MPITQEDIAKRLGISRVLVSYALKGNPRVNAETRARILETAESMGYRPNSSARALATGRTYQIALCLPVLGASFYAEIIRQFEMLSRNTPYSLLVTTIGGLESESASLPVDGLVLYGPGPQELRPQSCHVVSICQRYCDDPGEGNAEFDSVSIDLGAASQNAMEHLLEQGYKRIAYIGLTTMSHIWEPRYSVYQAAMERAGLPTEAIGLTVPLEGRIREQTQDELLEYFAQNGFPEALFCSNDDIAMGAYRALRELKRQIPSETAVLGCDDINEARDVTPLLSTIRLPLDEVCQCAWQMLMQRIQDPQQVPQFRAFEGVLIVRESSLSGVNAVFHR